MQITYVISLLNALLQLVPMGSALFAKFTAQKAQAEQWQADGHTPTDEEWATLHTAIAADTAAIDAGAARA